MSPIRKPAPEPTVRDITIERREVDDPSRAQSLVRLLAELVAKRRTGQR